MEKSRVNETTTTKTDINNAVNTVHAERKRMLLSEVYVHKVRKLNVETNQNGGGGDGNDDDNEQFDVFHIFEFADDPNTKITPKLSTNCTEPRKIINVLRNRTGSDTPQLQRLIEKLSAQNKKWTENQTKAAVAPPPATAAATATTVTKAADSNLVLDGRDHTYNRHTAAARVVSVASTDPTASTASIPIRTISEPRTRYVTAMVRPSQMPESNVPTIRRSITVGSPQAKKTTEPPQPVVRVKTIESLTDAKETSTPSPDQNRPKQQAFAKKSVTVRKIVRTPNGDFRLKMLNDNSNTVATVQRQQQQPRQIVHTPNANSTTDPAPATAPTKLSTAKQTVPISVQQPVKLWNNMMSTSAPEPLKVHVMTRNTSQSSNATFPLQTPQQKPTVENPDANSDGASMLKIGQVFEGVNENCVEDLFLEQNVLPSSPAPTPPLTPQSLPQPLQSASPMLDTLVKEIEHVQSNDFNNGTETASINDDDDNIKLVTIVQNGDKSCADYRCNICLDFNDSSVQYRDHMLRKHGFTVICDRCHEAFNHREALIHHLKVHGVACPGGLMKCSLLANASRTYICIVEPPIILMRNEKVFAFRCKYCSLAFQNQRNYVQHAQRHAKLFRCKQCPTKPLSIELMREHLTHHKN